jgi:hypothetical protein
MICRGFRFSHDKEPFRTYNNHKNACRAEASVSSAVSEATNKEENMSRHRLFLVLVTCLAVGFASSASAATTWKRLGANPFYRPSLTSETDLKTLVKDRSADLKAGFAKAGYPDLYPAFMEQFPTAKIDSVKVAPGETFIWIVFKKKATGRVAVLKDTTWRGAAAFDAYRFSIDKDGKRHEFVVPYACGNVALRGMAPIPPPPVAAAPPPPAPPAPAPVVPPPVAVAPPPPAPVVAPPVEVPPPAPAPVVPPPVAVAPPPPPPVAPPPAVVPPPPPVAKPHGGPLFDIGLSRQPDPANYVFARAGYEVLLVDRLYLMGLVGGSLRWMGNDGGSAFTADALLDYHWLGGLSVGLGAGYWSGNDGQVDLIADIGFLLTGYEDGSNSSLFLEARLPVDELDNLNEFGRFGLGLRFRL